MKRSSRFLPHAPNNRTHRFGWGGARREIVALVTLNAFVLSGWLLPFTNSLRGVEASERVRGPVSGMSSPVAAHPATKGARVGGKALRKGGAGVKVPVWYRATQGREGALGRNLAAVQAGMKRFAHSRGHLRLAQLTAPTITGPTAEVGTAGNEGAPVAVSGLRLLSESFPVPLQASVPLPDSPPVTPLLSDLSNERVPGQKEVVAQGGLAGPLSPVAPADPADFAQNADTQLRIEGFNGGLSTNMPPSEQLLLDPTRYAAAKRLEEVRERVRSARRQNREFTLSLQKWNTGHFQQAADEFAAFAKQYPQSPWTPEALIQVANYAKFTGRGNESEDGYRKVMAMTSNDPGAMSYNAHRKAFGRLTDLYLMEGRYGEVRPMLEDFLYHDTNWRRRTWGRYWLAQISALGADQKRLLAERDCGAKALAALFAATGHPHQARAVAVLSAPRAQGFSLADLQGIAGRQGLVLTGFAANPARLRQMALPVLLHYSAHALFPASTRHTNRSTGKFNGSGGKLNDSTRKFNGSVGKFNGSVGYLNGSTRKFNRSGGYLNGSGTQGSSFVTAAAHYGHFVLVRAYNAKRDLWDVLNPQDGTSARLGSSQLARQWSGKGLLLEKPRVILAPASIARTASKPLVRLSLAQMRATFGTGYGVVGADGNGCNRNNRSIKGSCGGGGGCAVGSHMSLGGSKGNISKGEPSVSVNAVTQNIFITDTPVWYQPAKGPSVEISLSYNSLNASNYNTLMGNKWDFNYGSYIAELPNVRSTIYMPDGAQLAFTPPATTNGIGTYTSPRGEYSTLTKTADKSFTLTSQGGDQRVFGIPANLPGATTPVLLRETDRWGQSLLVAYGSMNGKVVPFTLTDADGKLTRLQYDVNGHLIYAQTPDERQASFSYDASGNLIQCVDAAGQAFQYSYDALADVTQLNTAQGAWFFKVDQLGNNTRSTYNRTQTTITNPTQANPESFLFDDANHTGAYSYTDHGGTVTSYTVQALNGVGGNDFHTVIGSEQTGNFNSVSYSYDPTSGSRLLDPTLSSNGRNQTTLTYNAQGRPVSSLTYGQDPNEAGDGGTRTTQLTYDPNNGLDVVSASVSGSTTRAPIQTQSQVVLSSATYNAQHQPLVVFDAAGHEVDTSYMAWGAVASVTTYEGATTHVTQYVYGQMGGSYDKDRVVSVLRDGTTQATYSYDASGRVRLATDVTGRQTFTRYNNLDLPLGVYYPDGTSQLTDYTCCALPGMVTDRSGRRSYYDYDQLKRLVRVQDADGQTLQMDYNADSDRVSLLDANGMRTRWSYDGAHRPVNKTYADGTQEKWDYLSGCNVLGGTTNARGGRTVFSYSRYDELAGITYPNAATGNVSLSYDLLGRKASLSDGIGTTNWSYYSTGRLQGESGPFGNDSLGYSYDSLNRLQGLTIGRNATSTDNQTFGYDPLGRLASVTATVGSFGSFGSIGTFGYSYVGNTGLLAQMTRPNGTKTVLSYENSGTANALHRLTGIQDQNATGGNIASFGYGYDSPGTTGGFADNRTSQTRSYSTEGAQSISYSYGQTSMLQGEGGAQGGASTPAVSKSYVFDAMGNRTGMSDSVAQTQTTSTYNPLNQLTGQNNFSTASGAAVATGSSSFSYDNDGNMALVSAKDTSGAVTSQTSYSYDDVSRLVGITTPGVSKWQFLYDGLSRLRISRSSTWTGTAWSTPVEKRRIYLGMDVVQERDASNNVTASYTRTGNIGGLLARSTSTGSVYYGYDGGGNVTSLTDSAGAIVGSYTYDAWGNLLASSGAKAAENPFRFSSKEALAGLYLYGYRFYSSGLGRWINRDPVRERGGMNVYEFVGNGPTSRVDGDGRFLVVLGGVLAGAVLGGFFSGLSTYLAGGSWCDVRVAAIVGAIMGAIVGGLTAAGVIEEVPLSLVGCIQAALTQGLKDLFCNRCKGLGQVAIDTFIAGAVGFGVGAWLDEVGEGSEGSIGAWIVNNITFPVTSTGLGGTTTCPGNSTPAWGALKTN